MSETLPEKSEVETQLEKLVAPLQKLSDDLGRKEAKLVDELTKLRSERNRVGSTLRSLLPPIPKEDKEPIEYGRQKVTVSTAVVSEVRAVVSQLDSEWAVTDVQNQVPHITADTIRKALVRLRDNGEVRLTSMKRGRGGGMVLTTTPKGRQARPENGSEPEA